MPATAALSRRSASHPAKLDRDQRLALFSDPVTLARMHYRLWQNADKYHDWLDYYHSLELNPKALNNAN